MWVIIADAVRVAMCEQIQAAFETLEDAHLLGALHLVKNAVWRTNQNGAVYVDRSTAQVLLQWVANEDPAHETDLLGYLTRNAAADMEVENFRVVLHAIAGMRLCRYAQFMESN